MGVALNDYGSRRYLAGTMKNFLDHTNITTGEVQGCLKPSGATGGIYHAKPIIVQGAWLSCKGNASAAREFLDFAPQMASLLAYWDQPPRYHPLGDGGLYVWHDQLQSGADNLVISDCPSKFSFWCWREAKDANSIASVDLPLFLSREHRAFAYFNRAWGRPSVAATHEAASDAILQQMDKWLWSDELGLYVARNVKTNITVTNRVYLMGMPLWGGVATAAHAERIRANLMAGDMLSSWGVRSTSSEDRRYSNVNEIVPYSNWRGPIWTNANAMLALGMSSYPALRANATEIARRIVRALADDLRATGTWHECMSSASGAGLAAPGFLSWNTLGARLKGDVASGVDPFAL